MSLTVNDLRHFAVTRSLFAPTSLARAMETLGFLQADPIRAPARAQDLTLRHRVTDYRAGDLERRYPALGVEEDTFINYGFVTPAVYALMHPRSRLRPLTTTERRRAQELLAFIRDRGTVHPRDVDRHFSHGNVTNYWGGVSKASTNLLDHMHYCGMLRITGRQDGIRTYGAREPLPRVADARERAQRLDRLIDVLVRKYAPLPARGLAIVVRRLRYAAPQWHHEITRALVRARARLSTAHAEGTDWYWPTDEHPGQAIAPDLVRLLTPFDPVVWDRGRFEQLWGWEYRFEAYTPVAKRIRGYYALPLLWREQVIGWANVAVTQGRVTVAAGFVSGRAPRDRAFQAAMADEVDRLRRFLELPDADTRRRQA